jgi:DNA-directed RNA polymerase subunit RPC12/RpoP
MTIKKPTKDEKQENVNLIKCPNCNSKILIEDLGMVMFESCTVFSCPICNKTIAIQPKGEEFSLENHDHD